MPTIRRPAAGALFGLAFGDAIGFPSLYHRMADPLFPEKRRNFLWRINSESSRAHITTLMIPFTHIFDYISARFSDEATILPVEQVFPPGATRTEIREENQAEMAGSQQGAAAVALRELGFEVEETVTVVGIDEASTFVGSLKEGDIITGVNGTPTDSSEAVRAEVAKVPIDGED